MADKIKVKVNVYTPIYVVVLVLLLIQMFLAGREPSRMYLGFSCLVSLTIAVAHMSWRSRVKSLANWIGLDTLFILGFLLCHFSVPFYFSIGALSTFDLIGGKSYDGVSSMNFASSVANIGLCSFSLAFQLFYNKYSAREDMSKKKPSTLDFKVLWLTAYVLNFIGFGLFLFFVVSQRGSYLSGGYGGMHDIKESYGNILSISHMLMIAGSVTIIVYAMVRYKKLHVSTYPVLGCMAIYVLLLMIHGDRGGMVQCLAASAAAFLLFKKVPLYALLVGIFLGLPILQIMLKARASGDRGVAAIMESVTQTKTEGGMLGAAKETVLNVGGSGMLTGVAVEYVEDKGSRHGVYTADGFFSLIPFSRRYIQPYVFKSDDINYKSSTLLTYLVNGHNNWGVGTNTVSESYIDFGLFGLIYSHIFIGFVAGAFEGLKVSQRRNITIMIFYCVAISVFVILARYGVFTYIARSIVYPMVAYLGVSKVIRSLNS